MRPSQGAAQRPMSARTHAANRVDARIAVVHRRIGTTSSIASFARCAACDEGNGPRNVASPFGSRTTLSLGYASAGSSLRYAYRRHVLPRRL